MPESRGRGPQHSCTRPGPTRPFRPQDSPGRGVEKDHGLKPELEAPSSRARPTQAGSQPTSAGSPALQGQATQQALDSQPVVTT